MKVSYLQTIWIWATWSWCAHAGKPLSVVIRHRTMECLYDTLEEGENVTVSAFLVSGPTLKASMHFEGPVAPLEATDGPKLQTYIDRGVGNVEELDTKAYGEVVDFEIKHKLADIPDEDKVITIDDDDDEEIDEEAEQEMLANYTDPHDIAMKKAELSQKRKERAMKKKLLERALAEQQEAARNAENRDEGEPFQKTYTAEKPGWYRYCLRANYYQVTAEMEMRKLSALGGMGEDGHVRTFEERDMLEEEQLIEEEEEKEDPVVEVDGAKAEDFSVARERLKNLRRLIADIQSRQEAERKRLLVHSTTNSNSYSRMVNSSLFQTILFVAVTCYQVYTMRRWFSGAPVLG